MCQKGLKMGLKGVGLVKSEFGRNFETYYKRQFGFYFPVKTSFDHNLAIPSLFDPFFSQK